MFLELAERRDVGAMVLTAAGERAFCGGIYLKESPVAARGARITSLAGAPRSARTCLAGERERSGQGVHPFTTAGMMR
jgi:enoyl-CoA hydratase/carnithine racemase